MMPIWKPTTKADFETLAKIKSNPFYWAVFKIESSENPLAENVASTAKGAFQLTRFIREAYGIKGDSWKDLTTNFKGFVRLMKEHMKIFKTDDPILLYAAHYLGAPSLKKQMEIEKGIRKKGNWPTLNQKILAEEFESKIRPRFEKIYKECYRKINING